MRPQSTIGSRLIDLGALLKLLFTRFLETKDSAHQWSAQLVLAWKIPSTSWPKIKRRKLSLISLSIFTKRYQWMFATRFLFWLSTIFQAIILILLLPTANQSLICGSYLHTRVNSTQSRRTGPSQSVRSRRRTWFTDSPSRQGKSSWTE